MKPILQAAIAAALTTSVLANVDPPHASPASHGIPPATQPAVAPAPHAVPAPAPHAVPAPAPVPHAVPGHHAPATNAAPATAVKPKGAGLNEILREGNLPVLGGGNAPFSGKLTLLGDDGHKREVTYNKGQIVSWKEWHEGGAVTVEREFDHGVEVKRTGWRGNKKWFEITFAVQAPPTEIHPVPAPHTTPGTPTVPPVLIPGHGTNPAPPVIPGKTGPAPALPGLGAPTVPPVLIPGHGTNPVPPVIPGKTGPAPALPKLPKPAEHGKPEPVSDTQTKKPKWPAFVPGNPDFPITQTTTPGHPETSEPTKKPAHTEPSQKEPANPANHDNHRPPAIPAPVVKESLNLPKMETRPTAQAGTPPANPAITPAIVPVPRPIGPAVEQRPDHLVYVRGSGLPYTGKATLLDENGKKSYEGSFRDGRREGVGMEWYANGQKKADGDFRAGSIYEGSLFWYFIGTFKKKMQVEYRAGKVVEAHLWNRDGSLRW